MFAQNFLHISWQRKFLLLNFVRFIHLICLYFYPIGRLDLYTEGLLLLTNDGELAQNLTHPSKGVEKTYEVRIKGRVRVEDLQVIANGVKLEDFSIPSIIIEIPFAY